MSLCSFLLAPVSTQSGLGRDMKLLLPDTYPDPFCKHFLLIHLPSSPICPETCPCVVAAPDADKGCRGFFFGAWGPDAIAWPFWVLVLATWSRTPVPGAACCLFPRELSTSLFFRWQRKELQRLMSGGEAAGAVLAAHEPCKGHCEPRGAMGERANHGDCYRGWRGRGSYEEAV